MADQTFRNVIGGELCDAADAATYDVVDPATGEVYAQAPMSGEADVDKAYAAAASAFETWGETTPQERSLALLVKAMTLANDAVLEREEDDQNGNWKIIGDPTEGALVVAAAGNDGGPVYYPAAYAPVVAVASTNSLDHRAGFSNHGPQVDLSAPGVDIYSTWYRGNYFVKSGTSMAAPHVSGVAALLTEIHPSWSPAKIKALIMNQATQDVSNNDGTQPVPATVMGTGRVRAFRSATADSLAWPGSLSYGLQGVSDFTTIVKSFTLQNLSNHTRRYEASASVRYNDFSGRFASVEIAIGDEQLAESHRFALRPGRKVRIHVELTLDPDRVPGAWRQQY